ncbi:MAG: hypothetical protein ACK45T_02700 [Pseudanabaena sp.]|jgi:hypothetical protein|nr:hypothetical protein [Pseudanabaena sp. M53BS1SP1A06MG]MCA6581126.1 hypothetical protein [Pseudanabaena sp. M34BS1SP1A06MG]MCA6592546.1 hypothetical protein [Pseudanabaena sp. M38BS1SP1A06MG]MCA6601318.1 hypothetical protein [Pseudanabaena sp. M57BS1SP1A06MG]
MTKIVMYFVMFVGAIAIAAWVSREFSYFFNNLLYWIRYNWVPSVGLIILGAITYKVFSSKS